MACNFLGYFNVDYDIDEICKASHPVPYPIPIYGDSLNLLSGFLYLGVGCGPGTALPENAYFSDGNNIYYYDA